MTAAMVLCACCLLAMTGCDDGEVGTYTLFECPTSPSTIDDFAPYRDPASVENIRATIYAEVSSRIESEHLGPCVDPGDWDDCVEGSYTTADGAQVEYRLASTSTTTGTEEPDLYTDTVAEETAHVALPEGAATWSALDWSETYTVDEEMDAGYAKREFSAAWTGSLVADWPADFALEGTTGIFSGDDVYSNFDYASLVHESCDFSVSVSQVPTAYIKIYDHELLTNDQEQGGNCTIDGECVGVIDVEAWEIVGGCE